MSVLHFRFAVPVRPGMVGRVSCGTMVPPERLTLVWKRVTCRACRRSVAFEQAVLRWADRNVTRPNALAVMVQIKRDGYAAWCAR